MENKKITIQDIVDEVAAQGGFTKKYTEDFLRELVDVIEEYLNKDGLVKVKGLGTFKLLWNEERKSVNVMTQEEIVIPAHYKVSFSPEAAVKERINEPYAHLSTIMHSTPSAPAAPSMPEAPVQQPESGYMMPASELRPDMSEPQVEQPVQQPASEPGQTPSPWAWSKVETPVEPEPAPEPEPEPAPQPQSFAPESGYMMPADELRREEPEDPVEPAPAKKKSKGWLVFLTVLLVLALLAVAAWLLRGYWWSKAEPYVKPVVNEYCPQWMIPQSLKAVADTVAVEPAVEEMAAVEADSTWIDAEPAVEELYNEHSEEEENAQYLEQNRQMLLDGYTPAYAQQVPVREVVTVINGSRLTMVSLRAYGHKDFWVYIYDANRDQMANPGAVKPGMSLRIPDMDPLMVDPDNVQCLEKARELARKY